MSFTRLATVVAVLTVGVFGLWAYFAPVSFSHDVAPFAAYSHHYIRDAGAFQIGIATSLLAASWWADSLGVALVGFVVASAAHAASHFSDHDTAGALALTVAGLLAAAALILRTWARQSEPRTGHRGSQESTQLRRIR